MSGRLHEQELAECDGLFTSSNCAGVCQNADIVALMYLRVGNWTIIPEDATKMDNLRNVPQLEQIGAQELVSESRMSKVIFSTRKAAVKNAWKNLLTTFVVLCSSCSAV